MTVQYTRRLEELQYSPKTWLITGVAGFIGSNLLETLLKLGQRVVGLDNLSTGHMRNLEEVRFQVSPAEWASFRFLEGDIRSLSDCQRACHQVDFILHQAALGSVPRSFDDPLTTNETNVTGFLNMLVAAKQAEAKSFVYAASSSTYGDHPGLPKIEEIIGQPLSPYAVTKYVNELYAAVFARGYGFKSIGLRYFNVFGKRQDPSGSYAAVMPKWISAMSSGSEIVINGDGETSRDFCFVDNVVQANLLAATATQNAVFNQVYNVAVGERTTLNSLFSELKEALDLHGIRYERQPCYQEFRKGDVLHSQASIKKARDLLGYHPEFNVRQGIRKAVPWYLSCAK